MRVEKTIEAKQIQNLRLVNSYRTLIASSVRDKSLMNPAHGRVYLIQCNVIKFVSDLWQVGVFLWIFRFPPIQLTAMI
jgi:hypothetical protein